MARGKRRGNAGSDMMNRHEKTGLVCTPILAKIELCEHRDPGLFRDADRRKLEVGEKACHVIVGGVFAHLKIRWAITADSQSEAEIQYERDGQWRSSTSSKIYGDAVAADFTAVQGLESAPDRPEGGPVRVEDYLMIARFPVQHAPVVKDCVDLPHEVTSRIIAGLYHPRIDLPELVSTEVIRARSYTTCR